MSGLKHHIEDWVPGRNTVLTFLIKYFSRNKLVMVNCEKSMVQCELKVTGFARMCTCLVE